MAARPHAFVAMPFGVKPAAKDPAVGDDAAPVQLIDFNRVYAEYIHPALESAGFEAFRADHALRARGVVLVMLRASIESYTKAFRANPGHYDSGINAFTLMHLYRHLTADTRDDQQRDVMAGAVRFAAACESDERQLFWAKATLGDPPRNRRRGHRGVRRRVEKLKRPEERKDVRQGLLFSGHIVDAPNRPARRFPADKEDIEACQARGARRQVLLPFAEPEFIERSIVPSTGGDTWRDRLYTALALDVANVRFVCLWNGGGGDGPGGTRHMYEEVKTRTGRITWIDTRKAW